MMVCLFVWISGLVWLVCVWVVGNDWMWRFMGVLIVIGSFGDGWLGRVELLGMSVRICFGATDGEAVLRSRGC